MKYEVAVCTLAVLLVSACVSATSRVARPLEIRSSDEGVLGCLPADEGEIVEIDTAGVSSVTVDGRKMPDPWVITLDAEMPPLRLAPGECLVYGQLPEGYSAAVSPAELRSEWPYTFGIRSPEWGRHGTRNHSGLFCVRKSAAGAGIVVANLPKGPAVVTAETCKQYLDAIDTNGASHHADL